MALTLEAEQRLEDVGLIAFYTKHDAAWLAAAKQTKTFVTDNFPAGANIRRDDVANRLVGILAVHEDLKEYLDSNKIRGKFWIRYFADLIIDRTWDKI